VTVLLLGGLTVAGTVPARAAGLAGHRFVDLGTTFHAMAINDQNVIVGQSGSGSDAVPALWSNGRVTTLPTPAGAAWAVPSAITDAGVIFGTAAYSSQAVTGRVVRWAPGTHAVTTIADPGSTYNALAAVDEASGTFAFNVSPATGASFVAIANPAGTVVKRLPSTVGTLVRGVTRTRWLVENVTTSVESLGEIGAGPTIALPFRAFKMASDGTVVGFKSDGTAVLRSASGATSTRPLAFPMMINARHDIGTVNAFLAAGAKTPVDITSIWPAGWERADGGFNTMADNGSVIGFGVHGSAGSFFALLAPARGGVSGRVLRGAGPNRPFAPAHPAAGLTVTVTGTSSKGAAVRQHDTTDSAGNYALAAPPGHYTVRFPAHTCASVSGSSCRESARVTVTSSRAVTLDAVALSARLTVRVHVKPSNVTLKLDAKTAKTTPRRVAVDVLVENTGVEPAIGVTAPEHLTRSYDRTNPPKVAIIPVTQVAGPEIGGRHRADVGRLAPGASKHVAYSLKASGDGVYDIEALVLGHQKGLGRIAGVGSARLRIGAPVLVARMKFGRGARGANGRALVQAGTPFTIAVTMQNRSYTKRVFVSPPKVDLAGNAAGGVFVAAGAPIVHPQQPNELQVSQYFTLRPRQTVHAEILVRTSKTAADVQNALGSEVGGTRAVVHVHEPVVHAVTDTDEIGARIPAGEVFLEGPPEFQVGLDDSSLRAEPEPTTFLGYTLAITYGTMQALWNLTIGGVIALFDGLRQVAESGVLLRLPRSIINYMEAEVALWLSIREGPTRGQFLDYFDSWLTLAYVHASGVSNSLAEIKKAANAALVTHLNRIADDYENGDWRGAVTELSREGTEAAGTLVLGTGVLTRWKPAIEAYEASKAALFTKFGELIDAAAAKPFIGAAEALATLGKAAPGYEFNYTDMARYYGLSEAQVSWLLTFCREEKILVTLRSRAAESLAWLDKGAVLKPEQIKIKTVNFLDAKWLGYGDQNVGRVIIRPKSFLPTENKLVARMRAAGLTSKDAEYEQALGRLKDRIKELEHPVGDQGYAAYLEDAAQKKTIKLRWNLEDNSVDPSYLPNGYTDYGFRLAQDSTSGSGNLVAQFNVNGTWRSVTGDVDLLSIVSANGSPLSEARRVALYKLIQKSPLGLMHPAADTWTLLTKVAGHVVDTDFNFPAKINEFVRGGTVAQFAPDRKVRAVVYNTMSEFKSAKSYRVIWDGGYNEVAGPPLPKG